MKRLYDKGKLPFFDERDILFREACVNLLSLDLKNVLTDTNSAWKFFRMEGPTLIPTDLVSKAYTEKDVYNLGDLSMRAETTQSSYVYANEVLRKTKPPVCIWQVGKSYRKEDNDGASFTKLRFNEFYQMEFQCIFSNTSKADYHTPVCVVLSDSMSNLLNKNTRLIDSDRLPSYSEKTVDIEAEYNAGWKEVASISIRNDYPDESLKVLEVAIGLDRLVAIR